MQDDGGSAVHHAAGASLLHQSDHHCGSFQHHTPDMQVPGHGGKHSAPECHSEQRARTLSPQTPCNVEQVQDCSGPWGCLVPRSSRVSLGSKPMDGRYATTGSRCECSRCCTWAVTILWFSPSASFVRTPYNSGTRTIIFGRFFGHPRSFRCVPHGT